jgi:hypothetical protein
MIAEYLLGGLNERQQEELEARYFADDALFEQLLAVEVELLDRYACEQLTAAARARFEEHFLKSPARCARLGFSKALLCHLGALPAAARRQRLSWWRELLARLRAPGPD